MPGGRVLMFIGRMCFASGLIALTPVAQPPAAAVAPTVAGSTMVVVGAALGSQDADDKSVTSASAAPPPAGPSYSCGLRCGRSMPPGCRCCA